MRRPELRPASRLLVIDDQQRILLFRTESPDLDAPLLWFTPGGGLNSGETHEQAATRELLEETGIVATFGPCVWTRRHIWRLRDRYFDQRERYYVVRVPAAEIDTSCWEELERELINGSRWWPLEQIATADDAITFVPRALGRRLPPILAGDYPGETFDAGV